MPRTPSPAPSAWPPPSCCPARWPAAARLHRGRTKHQRAAPARPHRHRGRARRQWRGGAHPACRPRAHRPKDPAGRPAPSSLRVLETSARRQGNEDPHRPARGRRRCRHGARPRPGAGRLPEQDHHHRRADRRRRRQRRDGAHHRAEARAAARADRDHRQPGRRQRLDRQRVRGTCRARRPHPDAGLHRHPQHEPGAAEAALRPHQGLRAHRPGGLLADADGGQPAARR